MLLPALIGFGVLGLLLRKKKSATLALPPGKTAEEINAELWAQPGADFVVEVYGVDKFRAPPPPSSDSVTASANCDTIVVGAAWWDVAGAHADTIVDSGITDPVAIASRIMVDMVPRCAASGTKAAYDLRDEIADRIKYVAPKVPQPIGFPTRNGNIHYGVGIGRQTYTTPPTAPQAGIFDAIKKIKLPKKCGDIVCPPGWSCHVGQTSTSCQQPSPDGSSVAVITSRGMRVIPTRGGNLATLISGRR